MTDPAQLVRWLAPEGAHARIDRFEPYLGGEVQITLTFEQPAGHGKTSSNTDVVKGRFLASEQDRCVKQTFAFESADPAFAGAMIITWRLALALGGTRVEVIAEDVPDGISPGDHQAGMVSSLANLAALLERGEAA